MFDRTESGVVLRRAFSVSFSLTQPCCLVVGSVFGVWECGVDINILTMVASD